MSPSNQVERNGEEPSASSGGSFVHSMNLLTTAKNSSSSDSHDASDMSGELSKRDETSEVSEESDPENQKDATEETSSKSDSKDAPKESEQAGLSPSVAAAGNEDSFVSQQYKTSLNAEELIAGVAGVLSNDSSQTTVEALALIAVEAAAKHAPIAQLSEDANATGSHLEPPADNPRPAASRDSIYARQLSGGASSGQSVEHTAESSTSGNSSRSDHAAFLPSNAGTFQTLGAAGMEPTAPLGHIHLQVVSSSTSTFIS